MAQNLNKSDWVATRVGACTPFALITSNDQLQINARVNGLYWVHFDGADMLLDQAWMPSRIETKGMKYRFVDSLVSLVRAQFPEAQMIYLRAHGEKGAGLDRDASQEDRLAWAKARVQTLAVFARHPAERAPEKTVTAERRAVAPASLVGLHKLTERVAAF
ncbi:hypothetical protein [Acidithiobacillus ferrooxidans]|nr:hypothetical protein [Acidithiobacillus ferrooxidans]